MTEAVDSAGAVRTSARAEVGRFVEGRLRRLGAGLANGSTRAVLASLRRVVARDLRDAPEAWETVLAGAPGSSREDEPTRQEAAIHAALTLYAVHQQSRGETVHERGAGLGRAVRALEQRGGARGGEGVSPVRRRFDAVITSDSLAEVRHHVRGLVTQMSAHGIRLDYAQLAEDFFDLQDPRRAPAVRLRWARDYHRTGADDADVAHADPTAPDAGSHEQEERS